MKKVIALIMVCVLSLTLFGCGKKYAGKGGGETTKAVTPVKQDDGRYLIRISGIAAHSLGDMYTITGTAGKTFTVQVSALSYVRSVLNAGGSTAAAKNGMSSLYAYYASTLAYREAH